MGTRRDFAAAAGLAIAGARGRLSREANAYCDKAEAEGTVFTGAAPVQVKKSPKAVARQIQPTAKSARAISDAKDDEAEAFNIADRTHPIGSTWKSTSGQIVGEATVCAPCGFSLGWHRCEHPQAVVSPGVIEYVRLV